MTDLHTWVFICIYANVLMCANVVMWIYSRIQNLLHMQKFCTYSRLSATFRLHICKFYSYANLVMWTQSKICLQTKIYQLRHRNADLTLFQRRVSSRIIVNDWPVYYFYVYWNFQVLSLLTKVFVLDAQHISFSDSLLTRTPHFWHFSNDWIFIQCL